MARETKTQTIIPKTQKIVLDISLLNTQHKVWIKGKYSHPGKGVVAVEKGTFGLPSTIVANFKNYRHFFLLIYVYFQLLQMSGIEGEQVVLLLEDHHLVDPAMLELINSLLSAGEVPGLYTPEELGPLLAPLKDMASEAGFIGSLFAFFVSRKYFYYNFVCFIHMH